MMTDTRYGDFRASGSWQISNDPGVGHERTSSVNRLKTMSRGIEGVVDTTSSSSEDEGPPISTRPRVRPPRKTTSPKRKGVTLALTSGVFASFAGTFAKFAINQTETLLACEHISSTHFLYSPHESYVFCDKAAIYIRFLAFAAMILLNTIMWTTFVKALRYCKTSLEATVTNTAANFFSSAIVGQVIFEESVSLMWWLGTVLIIIGLLLMNYGGNKADESKKGPTRRRKCKSR